MAPILTLEKISKRFGAVVVANGIDLSLDQGEALGIIGPNGAGKTTLFNMLTNFIPPDNGRVVFNGQSLQGVKPHKIVTLGIARTFQLCRPFVGLSVLENVLVGSLGPRVRQIGRASCRERV